MSSYTLARDARGSMDVSKEAMANRILGMVKPICKTLVTDFAFTLEGQSDNELPEAVLGAARLSNVDISDAAVPLFDV